MCYVDGERMTVMLFHHRRNECERVYARFTFCFEYYYESSFAHISSFEVWTLLESEEIQFRDFNEKKNHEFHSDFDVIKLTQFEEI